MNRRTLEWMVPALAALTLACALAAPVAVWLLAPVTLAAALWRVVAGGQLMPAAAAAAVTVMALLWAHGVMAFLLILLAVVAVASLLRWDADPPAR